MAADGVFAGRDLPEAGKRIVCIGILKDRLGGEIGKRLAHDHNDVGPHLRRGCRFGLIPALDLGAGIAVRLIDRIQIIIVPEAVVEAERVEHGRDVVGVGDLEALVELFVRIDEADGSGKDRDAQHRAHDAHRPAAETRAFDENAQNDAQRGQNDDPGKLFPMQIQLIFTRGVHGLAD